MKVNEQRLLKDFIKGSENFIIPVYQRNYDWTKIECKDLYRDVTNMINCEDDSHFCGAVVSLRENNDTKILVDGQQRITTVNLMLIALCKLLEKHSEDKELSDRIYDHYLVNKYNKSDNKLKLKVSNSNRDNFNKLFISDLKHLNDVRNENNIFNNFSNFCKWLDEDIFINGNFTAEQFLDALERLEIVDIELEPKHGDNPQIIFETLNSTGKQLEQRDLIRNYLLMNLSESEQNNYYNNYWEKIEKNTSDNINDFFRQFIQYYTKNVNNKDGNLYLVFKDSFNGTDKKRVMEEIYKYSDYYKNIINFELFKNNKKEIGELLKNIIAFMGYTVVIPFIFDLIDLKNGSKINEDDFVEILRIVESFLFRRKITNESTASLRGIFVGLNSKIIKLIDDKNKNFDYIYGLKYILNYTYNAPNDVAFLDGFKKFNFFKAKGDFAKSFFVEMEKTYTNTIVTDTKNTHIEHIFPQNPNKKWYDYLKEEEINEIKEQYLNTVGNLALLGGIENEKASNKVFSEKLKYYHDSNIHVTRDIEEKYNEWNIETIQDRCEFLFEKAKNRWKYYNITNVDKENNINDMDEEKVINGLDCDFTNSDLTCFLINNEEFKVKNWLDFYVITMQKLYSLNNVLFFNKIVNDDKYNKIISVSGSNFRLPKKIIDDIFIETNNSTNAKIKNIKSILEDLDLDEINSDSFCFYVSK